MEVTLVDPAKQNVINAKNEAIAFTAKLTEFGYIDLTDWEKSVLRAVGELDYPPEHEMTQMDYAAVEKHPPAVEATGEYSTLDPESEVVAYTSKWTTDGEESLSNWETAVLRATGYIEYPEDHRLSKADYAAREKHEPEKPSVDWRAPFHMPKFNNEQYLKAKAEYVAKYGYTVTIPAMSDIFHFGKPKDMTPMERYAWSQQDWDYFSDDRLAELEKDKQHKKDRMLAMLAGPTPEVFAKLGAILTAVDDAQDAISTLAAVLRLARKAAPKAVAKIISGPLGILLTVNDILNLITALGTTITMAGFAKKTKDHVTASNPFSKKARTKRKLKALQGGITFADVIQLAQTTDQVFGVGVSLGPIVGLAQDLFHGSVRSSVGQKVSIKMSPHSVPDFLKTGYAAIKSAPAYLSRSWNSPDEEILMVMQAQAMAQDAILPYQQDWNPMEMFDNLQGVEIRCPIPTHPTTLAAMDDLGMNVEDVIGWPDIDKKWATPNELWEAYSPAVTIMLTNFVKRHKHDSMGVLATSIAADSAMYQLANIAGEENVEESYTVASRLASALLMAGMIPLPENRQNAYAVRRVVKFIEEREAANEPIKAQYFYNWSRYRGYQFYPIQ